LWTKTEVFSSVKRLAQLMFNVLFYGSIRTLDNPSPSVPAAATAAVCCVAMFLRGFVTREKEFKKPGYHSAERGCVTRQKLPGKAAARFLVRRSQPQVQSLPTRCILMSLSCSLVLVTENLSMSAN
jgi:hypothetical protein